MNQTGFGREREARKSPNVIRYDEMTKDAQYTINYENPSLPTFAAKEYFDDLFGERFDDWKSMRCALLSPAKKCAFVTDQNKQLIDTLESIGAVDVMQTFRSRAEAVLEKEQVNLAEIEKSPPAGISEAEHYNKLIRTRLLVEQIESSLEIAKRLVIYATPTGKFNQLPRPLAINRGLKDFIKCDLADVFTALVHAPRASENCLLLNSEAEVVPLLLKGAPYCMFSLNNQEYNAARNVITSVKQYLDPKDIEERIDAKCDKTLRYGESLADDISEHFITECVFSSILLDAESTNDRVSMNEDSSLNIFHPTHTHIRQSMPISQKNQLKKALQLCRPGGHITYVSNSLSHLQNEYVVQAAVKEVYIEHSITVRSVPLHFIPFCLPELNFYTESRLGQMVVPDMGKNFGPKYVCKLYLE
ncbi:unnamed protein product [Oikopleura dioica]|uniref:SAM-dependent MTase RsmB/NOP-type domain-containing protein n=1 Tax=Oikopleura dioica TaxID=34765 RepID=E4XHM5_OIKDI|nr:unnamed protein product [Oikopleura dioica]